MGDTRDTDIPFTSIAETAPRDILFGKVKDWGTVEATGMMCILWSLGLEMLQDRTG